MTFQSQDIKFILSFPLQLPTCFNVGSIGTFQRKSEKRQPYSQFEQFVAQIKKGPDAWEFKTTTQNITMSEINYESLHHFWKKQQALVFCL